MPYLVLIMNVLYLQRFFRWLRCLLFVTILLTQFHLEAFSHSPKKQHTRIEKEAYLIFGSGTSRSIFRDMATSPLFYSGYTFTFKGGTEFISSRKETLLDVTYQTGDHRSRMNYTSTSSNFHSFEAKASSLFIITKNRSGRYSIFIGPAAISTLNYRQNRSLMNNSFGMESISSIMFSSKLKYNCFRRVSHVVRDHLYFYLDVSLINFNYRPGYAYNYLPQIENSQINSFYDYKLSVNGFRANSGVGYSRFLKNGNALRLSYNFTAYNAPGRFEEFSHATHSIVLSFLFRYK